MRFSQLFFVCAAVIAAAISGSAQSTNTSNATSETNTNNEVKVTFQKDIHPIFVNSCINCHNAQRAAARLNLSTLENTLKGSRKGAVVVPGNSSKSLLIDSVVSSKNYLNIDAHRKKSARLTDAQVALIRTWIEQGAK
jgi:uncharacterized membrane protein